MTSIEVLIEKTSLQSLTREKEELPTSISVACRAADVDLDTVGFTSIDMSRFNKSTNWPKIQPIQDDGYIFVNNTEYCDMV